MDERHQRAALTAGLVAFVSAIAGPLDRAAESRLAWHMAQHLLLISVAAPLLALGHPVRHALDLGPPGLRRLVRRPSWSERTATAAAATISLGVLLVWHVPALYDAALRHEPVHGIEHVTLLVSAMVLWTQLIGARALGSSVLWLFVVTVPMTAFGVAMTLASTPWYPVYVRSSTADALHDQQLAGVVMWAFGGLAALIAAVVMFAAWLVAAERSLQPSVSAGGTRP